MFNIANKFIAPAHYFVAPGLAAHTGNATMSQVFNEMFHEALEPARVETGIVAATLGFFALTGIAALIGA